MGVGSVSLPISMSPLNNYSYPSDWVDITNVPNNEIYLTTCDAGLATVSFAVTTSTGTYNVDWGDSTSTTGITSGASTQKTYTYGSGLTGTTLPNTTTFRCRVYTTGGTITRFQIVKATGINNVQVQPILASNFGTTGLTSMANMFFSGTSSTYAGMLEVTYLPDQLNSVTTMVSAFEYNRALEFIQMPTSMTGCTTFSRTFHTCRNLQYCRLPLQLGTSFTMANMFQSSGVVRVDYPTIMNGCTSVTFMYNSCNTLNQVNLPVSMTGCTNFNNFFGAARALEVVTFPTQLSTSNIDFGQMFDDANALRYFEFPAAASTASALNACFNNCFGLEWVKLPTTLNNVSNTSTMFQRCENLKYVLMPSSMSGVTNSTGMFNFCYSLESINLPTMLANTNPSSMFANCHSLGSNTNLENIGTTGATQTNANNFITFNENTTLTSFNATRSYSVFGILGGVGALTKLNSLRLNQATGSTWGGSSPQINISYNDLGQAALVQVFNDLPTVSGKTINITGCTGAAALTAPERAIATGKGWTITG